MELDKIRRDLYNSNFVKFYKKYMAGPLHFVGSIISWSIFVILFVCVVFLLYYFFSMKNYEQKGIGHEPEISLYTIISPSMLPNIEVNDVVIVNKIDSPEDVKVGDIISYNSSDFRPGETISVTHRVVEIVMDSNGEYSFYTKGDNNFVKDPVPVKFNSIMGRVELKIPQLGQLQFFLASKAGWLLIIVIPSLYIVAKAIVRLLRISEIGKKIPKNSFLFPLFNKPLLIGYSGEVKYYDAESSDNPNNIPTPKDHTELKSLDQIYADLKNISK